jgi:hypothetical protein
MEAKTAPGSLIEIRTTRCKLIAAWETTRYFLINP